MSISNQAFKSFITPELKASNSAQLISFEGIEGAGKSTQITQFKQYLESQGKKVIVLREPGGTTIGEQLRSSLLNSQCSLMPLTETLIFLASRCELLAQKILPLLSKDNTVVILDRYIDSTISYQGYGRGLRAQSIIELHSQSPLNVLPHRTYYLNISEELSQQRQQSRGDEKDYFEKESAQFYHRLKLGFDELAQTCSDRIKTIDASLDIASVQEQIQTDWQELFLGK